MFLRFVLVFWLRSVGISRSLPSGKLVSQTSRLGIRPALPTVQTRGAHPQRSRQTTPLHSTSNAGSVPKRWLARVLLIPPVRCVGVTRQFIVVWFDHTQPSPLLSMASTGHPSMASPSHIHAGVRASQRLNSRQNVHRDSLDLGGIAPVSAQRLLSRAKVWFLSKRIDKNQSTGSNLN